MPVRMAANMGSSFLLNSFLLVTTLLFLLLRFSSSDTLGGVAPWCLYGGKDNYTANSLFESNLNTLLTNLSASTPSSSGFLVSYSGSVPNRVYGLALCRGDANSSACSSCLDNAISHLPQCCPYNKDAIEWYDDCLLHYSSTRFAGRVDYGGYQYSRDTYISSPEVAYFNDSVLAVLTELRSKAVSDAAWPPLFATGQKDLEGLGGYKKVYGLVQCTRDITADECNVCLGEIFKKLPSCCSGHIGAMVLAASCSFRYELHPFFNAVPARVPPPLAPGSPPNQTVPTISGKKKKYSTGAVVAILITLGIIVIILLNSVAWYCLYRKRNAKSISDDRLHDEATTESSLFDLALIISATNNFSNKLGEGGFGVVYKGTLPNGQQIAVKRILRGSLRGVEQLKNEIVLLAKLQHRNLVRFIGVCLEGDEKLLVYEFVANKSLDTILFDSKRKQELDWETRCKVIEGIARGLLYLHEDSRVTIIHRDLKASNILLDSQMNPKISDFGTARLFLGDTTHASTNTIIGTFGYMSPEYVTRGQFSCKSDVFSFGVLVLEIITGRKCSGLYHSINSELSTDLLSYVWEHWSSGSVARIVDPSLRGNYHADEATRCIQVALLCVQEQPNDRPMMSSIVPMLSSSSVEMHDPNVSTSASSAGSASVTNPYYPR